MKAIILREFGSADNLILEEIAEPIPDDGQVLIRVESASVNFADVVRRRNQPYPYPTNLPAILGGEVAGTVQAVGKDVTSTKPGDRVFALTPQGGVGGYAQYAVVEASRVIAISDSLDIDIACTLVVAGVTALQTLRHAGNLKAGESVFIPGASGGVGAYAVQLAKLLGAGVVIAGASTPEKREMAISAGADHAIDYTDSDWPNKVKALTNGRGADVILEMAGGTFFNQSLAALSPFGRLVVYGTASRETSHLVPQSLLGPCQSVTGYYVGRWFAERTSESIKAFNEISDHILAKRLNVEIANRLHLRDAPEAHKIMEERRSTGKIILKPWL